MNTNWIFSTLIKLRTIENLSFKFHVFLFVWSAELYTHFGSKLTISIFIFYWFFLVIYWRHKGLYHYQHFSILSCHIKLIDSLLPWVFTEVDQKRRQKCGKSTQWNTQLRTVSNIVFLTTFWRHLRSTTEQTCANIEFIC